MRVRERGGVSEGGGEVVVGVRREVGVRLREVVRGGEDWVSERRWICALGPLCAAE